MKQISKVQHLNKKVRKHIRHVISKAKHTLKSMLMPSRRSYLITTIFVLLFFFRQLVFYISPKIGYQLVGNLDVFYLVGVIYIILHYKTISKTEIIGILSLLLLYPILQSIFNTQYHFWRAYINIAKIILCYFTMKETIQITKRYKMHVRYGTMLFGYLCIASLVLAFIFQHSAVLWRLNDTVNVFDLKRLKLFYTEPGELGMHCSIVLIAAIYTLTQTHDKLKYLLVAVLPPIACLFFTKSLGGIAVGVVGIAAVFISDLQLNFSKKKLAFYIAATLSAILVAVIAIASSSGMYLRVKKVFSNADSSSRYRITMAFETVPDILKDTALLGTGFGNLELPHNVSKYHSHRLNSAGIINSYMNFIAESGIVGIVIVCFILCALLRACLRAKQPIIWGLTVFLIIYQFMGTYFTNPLVWILYGFIIHAGNIRHRTASTKKRQLTAKTTKSQPSTSKRHQTNRQRSTTARGKKTKASTTNRTATKRSSSKVTKEDKK